MTASRQYRADRSIPPYTKAPLPEQIEIPAALRASAYNRTRAQQECRFGKIGKAQRKQVLP